MTYFGIFFAFGKILKIVLKQTINNKGGDNSGDLIVKNCF